MGSCVCAVLQKKVCSVIRKWCSLRVCRLYWLRVWILSHPDSRKKQVPGELHAASSDNFPALDRTEGGHQCGLTGGHLLQNASLGLSLQGHQTGLLGLGPRQLTGKWVRFSAASFLMGFGAPVDFQNKGRRVRPKGGWTRAGTHLLWAWVRFGLMPII